MWNWKCHVIIVIKTRGVCCHNKNAREFVRTVRQISRAFGLGLWLPVAHAPSCIVTSWPPPPPPPHTHTHTHTHTTHTYENLSLVYYLSRNEAWLVITADFGIPTTRTKIRPHDSRRLLRDCDVHSNASDSERGTNGFINRDLHILRWNVHQIHNISGWVCNLVTTRA